MSNITAVLDELSGDFRKRLASGRIEVDLGNWKESLRGTIWYFAPPTIEKADKILRHINQGDLFKGQVEAIIQRQVDENGKEVHRTQADRTRLMHQDPDFISWLAGVIGAFDDITPDHEGAEGNSASTTRPGPSSSSAKDSASTA